MNNPLVITVILNTNRCADTLEALASLQNTDYANHRAIVLDNASTDGSVQAIRQNYPAVQIIELENNLGYAGNNNVGIQAAMEQGADWVFVLNEDTLVAADCLSLMVETAETDPLIGIVGPMIFHHNEPGVIQSAGGMLGNDWKAWHLAQNEPDHGQYDEPHLVDWISGCAIMIRRGVIDQVGVLDERFFYYWEETEWCLRAVKKGWKIIHIPKAKLWHKGVQRDYRPSPSVTYYSTRNRFILLWKHKAPLFVWIVTWGQVLRTIVSWSIKPKWRSKRDHRDAMWQGATDFLRRRWGMRTA